MELGQIIIIIIQFLLGIIIALIGFITKSMLKRIDELEVDVKKMKDNYLNRFAEVITNQHQVKEDLMAHNIEIKDEASRQFTEIKVAIEGLNGLMKNQVDFCHYVQKRKEEH